MVEEKNLVDTVLLFFVGCLGFLIVLQKGYNPLPLEITMGQVELKFVMPDFVGGDSLSNLRCLALVMVEGNQKDLLYLCNLHFPDCGYCEPIFLWLFLDCTGCQKTPQIQFLLTGETTIAQIRLEIIGD